MDGYAGNLRSRLQAFLDDLSFERFGVRVALGHGNPGDKGERARLKIRGHLRPKYWSSVGVFTIRSPP